MTTQAHSNYKKILRDAGYKRTGTDKSKWELPGSNISLNVYPTTTQVLVRVYQSGSFSKIEHFYTPGQFREHFLLKEVMDS